MDPAWRNLASHWMNRRRRQLIRKGRSGDRDRLGCRRSGPQREPLRFKPSPSLRSILKQIGAPEVALFKPDPFQETAVEKIESSDVLVCAPTGAGKTWIAVEAMARRLSEGKRCWYASPLKALSNSKYEEFRARFGAHAVGILTGDRKENPDAPVIVGTTEILRNQLYDAMEHGVDLGVDMVVLDEAHYLSDPDRGVVWEEVLIYLPVRVRVLMLSASVGNPEEICGWLRGVRGQECSLVAAQERPVPLYPLFLDPRGRVGLLIGRKGLGQEAKSYLREALSGAWKGFREPRWEEVVEGLRELDMLPAIFFLKSRADCDRAVETFNSPPRPEWEQEEIWEVLEPLLSEFPILKGHKQLRSVLRHRVGSHHAGHLPQWKLVVERLMNAGCLDAIFSTSTVAAGVDFPARTVVLRQSDRFNGREFLPLTATELQQMTGRAGRRGKDRVGFALFLPGRHQDLEEVARLLRSGPEPLKSRIQINFSMVLNLLLSHGPEEIRELLQRSLARVQGVEDRHQGGGKPRREWRFAGAPWKGGLPHVGERLSRGRLFVHRDGSVFVAVRMSERRGKLVCMAHKVGRGVKVRKGSVVLRGILLDDIQTLLPREVELPPENEPEMFQRALEAMGSSQGSLGIGDIRQEELVRAGASGSLVKGAGGWLWSSFLEHLAFLKLTGFVDQMDRLTQEGRWASKLRLDHPILVAEGIRRGALEGRSAPVLAGLMAPFVLDKDREALVRGHDLTEMAQAFHELTGAIYEMGRLMAQGGFPTPMLQFWPAAALYLWAKGLSWKELTQAVTLDEGDLVSLIVRTADHLRQVCDLQETHPGLANTARLALRRIQREPAVYL